MDDEQEQAQAHPPSWASIYGDDAGPPIFEDFDPVPGQRSSATRHANRVRRQEAELRQYREDLAAHFQARRKAEEDDPLAGVSSAELHAAKALHRPTARS